MIKIKVSYVEYKNEVLLKKLFHFCYNPEENGIELTAIDGQVAYTHSLDIDNEPDYNALLLPTANRKIGNYNSREPFATKEMQSGKKLYRRKHGLSLLVNAGATQALVFNVPYPHAKINKIEIINGKSLDFVDLKVCDDANGTYSTIPNYCLNQFGFAVRVADGIYIDKSDYDADLYLGMALTFDYTNNSLSDNTIGLNIILHEVK